jgi:hypothetical protein
MTRALRGVATGHFARRLLLVAVGLLMIHPGWAVAAPHVAVVESATAVAWLRSAGLECLEITGEQLETSVPDVSLLVLPLDRVRSGAALRSLTAFTNRGGKVVAVYWGTIARAEQQPAYPVYAAASLLGVRVGGWTMIGPAVVKPEAPVGGSASGMAAGGGAGDEGRAPGLPAPELRLERSMLIQVQPEATAQVLARLAPVSGEAPLVLAVRKGSMFYLATNLFEGDPHSPELRRLFFWMIDQAVPGLAFSQVRERAGAAVAAVIRARERLAGLGAPSTEAVQRLLARADEAAARAKSLAVGDRFLESMAAAEEARVLTEQAMEMMERH